MTVAFELVLAAVEAEPAAAWRDAFDGVDRVRVHHGSILDVDCDAVVSPANSFGYMRGGIDAIYARRFRGIEARVMRHLEEHHGGELPVGQAAIVETDDGAIPHLIVAPTMRTPMNIAGTDNPHRAARAAFGLAVDDERLRVVAMPGLGTGIGGVAFAECARQVRRAFDEVIEPRRPPASA